MTMQWSIACNNAALDAKETAMGATPIVRFYTGAKPANCGAAASGTKLAEGNLPADAMSAASGASKAKSGTWQATGVAAGDIGYYRLYDSTGTTCHNQGSVTVTGGGGEMTVDNVTVAVSQVLTVTGFTVNAANT